MRLPERTFWLDEGPPGFDRADHPALTGFSSSRAPQRRVDFVIRKTKISIDQENMNVSRETFFP
jgi:hypothetical protein